MHLEPWAVWLWGVGQLALVVVRHRDDAMEEMWSSVGDLIAAVTKLVELRAEAFRVLGRRHAIVRDLAYSMPVLQGVVDRLKIWLGSPQLKRLRR